MARFLPLHWVVRINDIEKDMYKDIEKDMYKDIEEGRGILIVKHSHKSIFLKQIEITTKELARKRPHIYIEDRVIEEGIDI